MTARRHHPPSASALAVQAADTIRAWATRTLRRWAR